MSANHPKISIVMPVLNRASTIEKAILSLVNQNYKNLEFIIIDGGSTDDTINIIKRYEQHIHYWHSKADDGPASAANMGIKLATGDLIALLMADDWYEPNTLNKMGEALMNHPDANIITCGGRLVYFDDKARCYKTKHTYISARELTLNFANICLATSVICCRFIRKSFYDRIGVFEPFDSQGKYMFSNDKEFLLRAVLHDVSNVHVNHLGYNYLASKASSTFGNHKANIHRLCIEHMEIAETYLKNRTLSKKQRFLLMYWYNDQSTRLLLYKVLDGEFKEACSIAKNGMKKYKLFWPSAFIFTTTKIILNKCLRKMSSLL